MTDQSDMDTFESIVSGAPATDGDAAATTISDASQPRSDDGRFTKPQEKPAASDPAPQPGAIDQPAANGGVPVRAVQDEREKRQEAQQRASDLERQIAVLQGQVTLLSQQRQPQQQPQQEKQPAALWDDPDAFLKEQLSPFQSEIQQMREELWESRASSAHGADKVEAAKKAAEALFGTPAGRTLHQQLTSGGNPFDNLVKWHQQQETLTKVGGDPDAWFNAELEKKLSDPAFLAQAMERARAGAVSNTNRSQPVTELPPSLSRLPSGGNPASGNDASQTDVDLFASTTARRR